ncbi:MAG: hypothetical protein KZQ56_09940 [gamma proteobacterium symbiont of Lucinoma myriamae]|nr:hypothetical protein [gamma proteobacterium symbiont of Lucinoma myriamae]
MQSFEQKNYVQAKKFWQPLAKEGDARAQYNLALILSKNDKKKTAENQLQQKKANQYLAMSRENGLVDSYFLKMPEIRLAMVDSSVNLDKSNSDKIEPLNWLNQQQKSNYTLQLATGKSRESMEISQKKLRHSQLLEQPENLYIQQFKRKEQEKTIINYVLFYGTFKSYQLAKTEAEKLPESIKKSSPWIRQFSQLQSKVDSK